MSNPIEPLSKLMGRLNDEAHAEGLNLTAFTIIPNYDPVGPHGAQAVFHVDPDWSKEGKAEDDPEFAAFAKAQEEFERNAKADEAREQLKDLADNLKTPDGGLGLD